MGFRASPRAHPDSMQILKHYLVTNDCCMREVLWSMLCPALFPFRHNDESDRMHSLHISIFTLVMNFSIKP